MTHAACLNFCKDSHYAALGNGQNCFCVNKFPTIDILPESDCNSPCTGDPTQKCGGSHKWNVYSQGFTYLYEP